MHRLDLIRAILEQGLIRRGQRYDIGIRDIGLAEFEILGNGDAQLPLSSESWSVSKRDRERVSSIPGAETRTSAEG